MGEIGIDFIQKLKKTNVSVDPEKTKERFQELWKSATKDQKAKVLADADVVRATIYRIYATGAVSAKIAVAAAQAFGVSPLYIVGDSDEPGAFSLEGAKAFLLSKGYDKLVRAQFPAEETAKPKRTRSVIAKAAAQPAEAELEVRQDPEPELVPVSPDPGLGEEELVLLLRALIIRSKASPDARRALDGVIAALLGN